MLRHPDEIDFRLAYDLSLAWAHGEIKMPIAKRAILNCHAVAKRLNDDYEIALCRAIGQGCSTVHVETHALGLVFYELTAVVIKCGYTNYQDAVLDKIHFYMTKLRWWQENGSDYAINESWADFLVRPGKVNKEKLLMLKTKTFEE